MARRRKKKGGVPPIVVGLVAAGGAAALYFALKPKTAEAASLPPVTRPPAPPPARSATTSSKPQMPSQLRTLLEETNFAKVVFWILGAAYTLDPTLGAPTAANVASRINSDRYDQGILNFFAANGYTPADPVSDVRWLYNNVKNTRFTLPYQVPTSVWNYINSFLQSIFGEQAPAAVEPK